MRIVEKPKYLKNSGALCQFCEHGGRCIAESGLGNKNCSVFVPMNTAKQYNIEIYDCTPEEGRRILEDLINIIDKAKTVLQMATANNIQHIILYMLEVRDRLMERMRYLNGLLPKVGSNNTFALKSKMAEGNWKDTYKTVMKKLDEYRTPEEFMEIKEQLQEEEAKSCSQPSSGQSQSQQSSTGPGKVGKSGGTALEIMRKMVEKKNNAGP